jgi:hypothetical protein
VLKTRKQEPGKPLSPAEASSWRVKLKGFVAGARARAKAKAKAKARATATIPLLANVHCARGFDSMLTLSTNLTGVKAFHQPGRGTCPLQCGESRYFLPKEAEGAPASLFADGQVYRSCIKQASGRCCLEIARVDQRECHTIADCGSVGFTQSLWNNTRGGMFGTHCSDLYAHDMNNSIKRACIQTGVWLLVLEWGLVNNFRKAPFNSDENFHKYREAGMDWLATARSTNFEDDLWLAYYPLMALQFGLWNDGDEELHYSVEHMEEVAPYYYMGGGSLGSQFASLYPKGSRLCRRAPRIDVRMFVHADALLF